MNNKEAVDYWENCEGHLIGVGGHPSSAECVTIEVNSISYKDKVVVEYGCGAGVVAKMILKHKPKKYIALDISERSLELTKKALADFDNKELLMLPQDFKSLNADILITTSVIQHFITEEIYTDFLNQLNESQIPLLSLQFRQNDTLKFTDKILYACWTNPGDIENRLPNYETIRVSEVYGKPSYQWIYLGLKTL